MTTDTRRIGVVGGIVGGAIGATGARLSAPETHVETGWRDQSLIFIDRTGSPNGPHTKDWSERRKTWSLEANGRLRVEIVSETRDRPRRTTVEFYKRE